MSSSAARIASVITFLVLAAAIVALVAGHHAGGHPVASEQLVGAPTANLAGLIWG